MGMLLLLTVAVFVTAGSARSPPHPSPFFSFKDCGLGPDMSAKVYSVSIRPDPVKFPGKVFLSFDLDVKKTVTNADMSLDIKKRVLLSWVNVPCIGGFGSCRYKNMCQYLDLLPDPKPVTCPISPQRITFNNIEIDAPGLGGVGGVVTGRYKIKGTFLEPDTNNMIACLELDVKLDA